MAQQVPGGIELLRRRKGQLEKEYTPQELAKHFKIDPGDVHYHLIKNDIPFIKTGRDYLISDLDLGKERSIRRKRSSKG